MFLKSLLICFLLISFREIMGSVLRFDLRAMAFLGQCVLDTVDYHRQGGEFGISFACVLSDEAGEQ